MASVRYYLDRGFEGSIGYCSDTLSKAKDACDQLAFVSLSAKAINYFQKNPCLELIADRFVGATYGIVAISKGFYVPTAIKRSSYVLQSNFDRSENVERKKRQLAEREAIRGSHAETAKNVHKLATNLLSPNNTLSSLVLSTSKAVKWLEKAKILDTDHKKAVVQIAFSSLKFSVEVQKVIQISSYVFFGSMLLSGLALTSLAAYNYYNLGNQEVALQDLKSRSISLLGSSCCVGNFVLEEFYPAYKTSAFILHWAGSFCTIVGQFRGTPPRPYEDVKKNS